MEGKTRDILCAFGSGGREGASSESGITKKRRKRGGTRNAGIDSQSARAGRRPKSIFESARLSHFESLDSSDASLTLEDHWINVYI